MWEFVKDFSNENGDSLKDFQKSSPVAPFTITGEEEIAQIGMMPTVVQTLLGKELEPITAFVKAKQEVLIAYMNYRATPTEEATRAQLDSCIRSLKNIKEMIHRQRSEPSEWKIRSSKEKEELQIYHAFRELMTKGTFNHHGLK